MPLIDQSQVAEQSQVRRPHRLFLLWPLAGLVVAVIVGGFLLYRPIQRPAVADVLKDAKTAAYQGDSQKAIDLCNDALRSANKPEKLQLYGELEAVYGNMRDFSNAVVVTQKAVKLEPSYSTYKQEAFFEKLKGDRAAAIKSYQNALDAAAQAKVKPVDPEYPYIKGIIKDLQEGK